MNYQILLHGKGLQLLDTHGERKRGGVYVWKAVSASNQTDAASVATRRVLQDPFFFEDILNEDLEEIRFEAEEIIIDAEDSEDGESGYVFYIDDDEKTEGAVQMR